MRIAVAYSARFIDPSLLTMNLNARDHNLAPFDSTPDPSRFQTSALSNTEVMLNQPTSFPHGNAQKPTETASKVLNKSLLLNTETAHKPSASSSPLAPHDGYPPNEFDWALREGDNSNTSDSRLGFTPGSCDPTKESESSISPSTGGCDSQETRDMDIDEDGPMVSLSTTKTPVCDRIAEIGHGSSASPPHYASAGTIQKGCSNEMETSDAEREAQEAQQDVSGNNSCETRPALGTFSPSPYSGAGLSYPTPVSNPPDTPIPTCRNVERSAEVTTSSIDSEDPTANKHQSTRSFSKFQPTVEDAPDDTEHDNPGTSSTNDEDFGDLDIESVLDEMHRFLQDTSETPPTGANDSVTTKSNPKTFKKSDQHELPSEEHTDSRQVSSECESHQTLQHKRKLLPGLESHSALHSRNLRPRLDKGKSGNQASHYDTIAEDAGENSSSKGVLARSVAGNRPDSSVAHPKTSVPSKPDKDNWSGPFLCHPFLSTLLPEKKDEIERKCSRILRPDLPDFIEKHTRSWKSTGFWHSPQLDVAKYPLVSSKTKGSAIWRYVDAMQAGEETHYLKSRLADIMLYLTYVEELNRQKKAGHPGQTAKVKATDIICGTASLSKPIAEKTRKSFHEHKLVGERWWWSGCYLGRGFFLLCSQETGKKMWSFPKFPGCSSSANYSADKAKLFRWTLLFCMSSGTARIFSLAAASSNNQWTGC